MKYFIAHEFFVTVSPAGEINKVYLALLTQK